MKKILEISYLKMRKDVNRFLRMCDLYQEGEGVYIRETMRVSFKKTTKLTQKEKEQIKQGLIKIADEAGIEFRDFEFKIIETL